VARIETLHEQDSGKKALQRREWLWLHLWECIDFKLRQQITVAETVFWGAPNHCADLD
jgi:hypothetical protein